MLWLLGRNIRQGNKCHCYRKLWHIVEDHHPISRCNPLMARLRICVILSGRRSHQRGVIQIGLPENTLVSMYSPSFRKNKCVDPSVTIITLQCLLKLSGTLW